MAAFTTMAIIAGVSAGVSAYGQWKAGKAAKKAGEAGQIASESEAQLTEWNAQVADLQAKDAIDRGAEEESRFRSSVRGMIGAQRAGLAANGVDVNYGSAVDVQADAAFLGELDALTIKRNAQREAWGLKIQGEDLRKRAEIIRMEGAQKKEAGKQQATAAYIGAAGTLLGTGASLAQGAYGFKSTPSRIGPLSSSRVAGVSALTTAPRLS